VLGEPDLDLARLTAAASRGREVEELGLAHANYSTVGR
jgi:hypothetical protein